jgi:chemotaxis protein methyltransferase CheR
VANALKINNNLVMDRIIKYVTELVAKESGNVFGQEQLSMVVNRIKKRMIVLGGLTPEDYEKYLRENQAGEAKELISLLTTHHTFFFREFSHFEFLIKHMDQIVANVKKRGDHTVRLYSAASSRGQEVYSLAMLFKTHMKGNYPGITFEVFGTDIDHQSVAYGVNGVYPYKEVKSIPTMYLTGNWQRGIGDIADFARVKPDLKKYCNFATGNLLDLRQTLGNKKFDVIFCRNVLIYLTHEDNEKIVHDIKNYLHPNGLLITGVSESLKSIKNAPTSLAPSVYTFDPVIEDKAPDLVSKSTPVAAPIIAASAIPSPIRMMCVDDSPAIVKLLSKIFEKDPDFEMVGTATNGLEAAEFLKNNDVDAMTLDIHMPEMDGVEYLKKHHHAKHPKVVVVSSASREDTRYALETLKHGATDFVEKPSLNNLGERADEIKMKLKMAFLNSTSKGVSSVDADFAKSFVIDDLDNKARVLIGAFGHVEAMCQNIKEMRGLQPPTFMFFEGNQNYLDGISERVKGNITMPVVVWDEGVEIKKDHVYICDFKRDMPRLVTSHKDKPVSIAVYGKCSKKALQSFVDFSHVQVLVEDSPDLPQDFKDVASDIFPASSFGHVATEFLSDPHNEKYKG